MGSLSDVLKYVGGTVKLRNMNATRYNNKPLHCYGIMIGADGSTKLALREYSAKGPRTYDGKYVRVNIDKVAEVHVLCAIPMHPIAIMAITITGLDPNTLVAPEFLVDPEFNNGYQAYDSGYHARKYGLKPVSGYILSLRQGYAGFICFYHMAFRKAAVIYVPIEHAGIASADGPGCFFLPDPELHPRLEEKVKSVLPQHFPEQAEQISSAVLVSPFRNMERYSQGTARQLKMWQNTQYLPMTFSWGSDEFARDYTQMSKYVCVIDREMAIAMGKLDVTIITKRDGPANSPIGLHHVQMMDSDCLETHPGFLARSCNHCKCICLNYVERLNPQTQTIESYCSDFCKMVQERGGVRKVDYESRPTTIPHWSDLDAMASFPVPLAKQLREAIYKANERTSINVVVDASTGRDQYQDSLDHCAKSPLPFMRVDVGCQDTDPTHTFLAMTDQEFDDAVREADAPARASGVYDKLRKMRARDTRSMAERVQRRNQENNKATRYQMPDGTLVSHEFHIDYSSRLMAKIEKALDWQRNTPFDTDFSAAERGAQATRDAELARQAERVAQVTRDAELARQAEARERARREHVERIRRHGEREKLATYQRKLNDLERRRKIAELRVAAEQKKARDVQARVAAAAPKAPPSSKKKGKIQDRRSANDVAAAAIHAVHVDPEQKAIRSRDFEARRELAHLEAEVRKAQALVDLERDVFSRKAKKEAERVHVVPERATMDKVFAATLPESHQ